MLVPVSVLAQSPIKPSWQFEIANDSPNGFKFSDAYETHAMNLRRFLPDGRDAFSAAIVAPKRPEDIDADSPANRAFGELLTAKHLRDWRDSGAGKIYRGSGVTFIGQFGLDSMQEAFHDLLGYRSVRDQLVSHRMRDAIMVSGFLGYRERRADGKILTAEAQFGTRRNAVSLRLEKPSSCQNWDWMYHAQIEVVANDEVVSAEPVGADIRHIVPTIGLGACTMFRGYQIRISEELSLPRILSDNAGFPMVRVSVSF